jgi:hypothetical protein
MPRKPLEDRVLKVKTATDIPLDLATRLDGFCRRRGVKKCDVWELALRRFLAEEYEKEVGDGERA